MIWETVGRVRHLKDSAGKILATISPNLDYVGLYDTVFADGYMLEPLNLTRAADAARTYCEKDANKLHVEASVNERGGKQ